MPDTAVKNVPYFIKLWLHQHVFLPLQILKTMQDDKPQFSQHLSNEQTFLSWVRTGLEVMAFGIVSVKFSLFTNQLVGILLVGGGALMNLFAYLKYRQNLRRLREAEFKYSHKMVTIVIIGIMMISITLLVILYDAYITGDATPVPLKDKIEETSGLPADSSFIEAPKN